MGWWNSRSGFSAVAACALALAAGCSSGPVARRPAAPFMGNQGAAAEAVFLPPDTALALANRVPGPEFSRNDYLLSQATPEEVYLRGDWLQAPRASLYYPRYITIPRSANIQVWFPQPGTPGLRSYYQYRAGSSWYGW